MNKQDDPGFNPFYVIIALPACMLIYMAIVVLAGWVS